MTALLTTCLYEAFAKTLFGHLKCHVECVPFNQKFEFKFPKFSCRTDYIPFPLNLGTFPARQDSLDNMLKDHDEVVVVQ